MAGAYCTQELEQAAIQLLPREIMAEVGIIVHDTLNSAAACSSHAVIEGLATHLASILGLAGQRTQRYRPRPANATPRSQHISRVLMTTANGGWSTAHVAPGSVKNDDMVLCPGTVKMFATPIDATRSSADLLLEMRRNGRSGTGVFLPAATHRNGSGGGTGVFMPLAGAYRTRPFKSPSTSSKGLKPPRLMRREAQWQ